MVENLTVRRDIVVDRNPNPNPDYPKQSASAASRASRTPVQQSANQEQGTRTAINSHAWERRMTTCGDSYHTVHSLMSIFGRRPVA